MHLTDLMIIDQELDKMTKGLRTRERDAKVETILLTKVTQGEIIHGLMGKCCACNVIAT